MNSTATRGGKRAERQRLLSLNRRRAGLAVWALHRQIVTDLSRDPTEADERAAAAHCKLPWEDWLFLKRRFPEIWARGTRRRERARQEGGWTAQPEHLRRHRTVTLPARRTAERNRNRQEQERAALLRELVGGELDIQPPEIDGFCRNPPA